MDVARNAAAVLTDAIGWALLRFVWEGCAIGVLVAIPLWASRRSGARVRYAICLVGLVLCAALPLWQVVAALCFREGTGTADGAADWLWPSDLAPRIPLMVEAWSLGAVVMVVRLVAGLAWVTRVRAGAIAAPAPWQATLGRLAVRLGAPLNIALLSVEHIVTPMTVGWWRPVVLVPASLLTRMPPPLLEALLAHELAHVVRRDYLVNLLQAGVEALLFFHPVVWWLSARLRTERELAADDLAATAIGDRHQLAAALDALAGWRCADRPAGLALSASGGSLLRRVEALAMRQPRATPLRSALLATLLSCAALLTQWSRIAVATEPTLASRSRAEPSVGAAVRALASVVTAMPAGVQARHALVVDEASGQVLMARDADRVVPIASLTKLITAMVVLDARLAPAQALRIELADVDRPLHGASTLAVGARMTRSDALVLALLASDNGAAAALARTYPGGPAAFDQALQAKIHALGLARTTLQEPTGLSAANASTAAEMARIVMASARYPEIAAITGERETDVVVDGHARHLRNHNPLVGAAGWQIRLSKTGFTRAAGDCLTMRLRAGGRDVTVVLLDTHDDAQRLRDAQAIQQALAPAPAI